MILQHNIKAYKIVNGSRDSVVARTTIATRKIRVRVVTRCRGRSSKYSFQLRGGR